MEILNYRYKLHTHSFYVANHLPHTLLSFKILNLDYRKHNLNPMKPRNELEEQALEFAKEAHGEQRRKYSDELFIEHPKRVAEWVRTIPHTPEMICAAYLHDVVDNTPVTIQSIKRIFGNKIGKLVEELTTEFIKQKYPRMNRRWRKEKEAIRQQEISAEAKSIRLAEIIDNTPSISQHDPIFAKQYIPEMETLVEALQGGNFKLLMQASYEVQLAKNRLESEL